MKILLAPDLVYFCVTYCKYKKHNRL